MRGLWLFSSFVFQLQRFRKVKGLRRRFHEFPRRNFSGDMSPTPDVPVSSRPQIPPFLVGNAVQNVWPPHTHHLPEQRSEPTSPAHCASGSRRLFPLALMDGAVWGDPGYPWHGCSMWQGQDTGCFIEAAGNSRAVIQKAALSPLDALADDKEPGPEHAQSQPLSQDSSFQSLGSPSVLCSDLGTAQICREGRRPCQ